MPESWHLCLPVRWAMGFKPPPLVNLDAGYGIVWSAKSASTTVLLWHLRQVGQLDRAMRHHPWPHKYRSEVLEQTPEFADWLQEGDPRQLKWYWIVRDPVKRALSSYRHMLKQRKFDKWMTEQLGRAFDSTIGYSLDDFMTYLERINVESQCNIHFRSQWHPVLEHCEFEVMNADQSNLGEMLNEIAARHGLPNTDFLSFRELLSLAENHYSKEARHTGIVASETVLTRDQATNDWPLNNSTLDPSARRRLSAIYDLDIRRIYGCQR